MQQTTLWAIRWHGRPYPLIAWQAFGMMPMTLLIVIALDGARPPRPLFGQSERAVDATFQNMPSGWTIVKDTFLTNSQVGPIAEKLGAQLKSVSNTTIRDGRRQLQINRIACQNEENAVALQHTLAKMHGRRS